MVLIALAGNLFSMVPGQSINGEMSHWRHSVAKLLKLEMGLGAKESCCVLQELELEKPQALRETEAGGTAREAGTKCWRICACACCMALPGKHTGTRKKNFFPLAMSLLCPLLIKLDVVPVVKGEIFKRLMSVCFSQSRQNG